MDENTVTIPDVMEWCEKTMLGRCGECDSCGDVINKHGQKYKGCFHKPYNGKWIAVVKECPKGKNQYLIGKQN